jgi:phytoene dehydrogenase-like protein
VGGGVTTVEASLPDFRHNLHAFFVRWTSDYTIWRDLDLDRQGVASIFPEVQNGLVFSEGERALVTYRDLDRSLAEIARIDRADAETYRRLHEEFSEMVARIETPLRFAAPLPGDRLAGMLSSSSLGLSYLELGKRSALEVVLDAFRSEPVRTLVLFNVAVRGYLPNLDVAGTGSIVPLALVNSHQGRLIAGGSGEMVRALAGLITGLGGKVLTGQPVESIDLVGGRAVGVTLAGGRKLRARAFVSSSVPAPITMLELVGREHLDPGLREELAGYRWLEEALFGVHWALAERPRFTAESYAPDLPRALNLVLGYESSDDLLAHQRSLKAKRPHPVGAIHAGIPTIHDPTQAPPAHHTCFGWHFVAGEEADQPRLERVVSTFSRYAPNLERSTLARVSHSPVDTEEMVPSMRGGDRHHGSYHPDNWGFDRPTAMMPGYRTPVEGLYLCGASQHPGGSFTGQPGYNAASAIAFDLGLECWWNPPDPVEALGQLA